MTNSESLKVYDASQTMLALSNVVLGVLQLRDSCKFEKNSEELHSLIMLESNLNCAIGHCAELLQFPFEQEENMPQTEEEIMEEEKDESEKSDEPLAACLHCSLSVKKH